MTLLVPVMTGPVAGVVVAVMVCCVAVALVVNVTVAMPLLFVGDDVPKLPPPELDHTTTSPGRDTALSLPSASCALIVIDVPATGVVLAALTMYVVAAPPVKVTCAVLLICAPPTSAVTVATPLDVAEVSVVVYTPFAPVTIGPRTP